jgi:outer membrane protein assembly factor BamA
MALIAQAQTAPEARVASVQVKGTRRYAPEQVTRLSGIEIGKPASVEKLTAAANRLAATGLFDSVRFTYTTGPGQMTVTFDVEEAKWTVPVILDNFVWLADEQLIAAVAEEMPSFDGTAPVNTGAAEFLTQALQKVLKARGIPGRVDFSLQAAFNATSAAPRYLFAVKEPAPAVCALHVAGASAIPERELIGQLGTIVGGSYSRHFLSTAAQGTLTDMYRRKGFWRAEFSPPAAALDGCQGVSVTLTVKEGAAYAWDHAEWSGTSVLAAELLNKAIGMKEGDTADATKIEAGLRDVHDAYAKQGYITERSTHQPRLDDAAHRAVFAITVDEGPQFHMGTLEFIGIREEDAAMLARKWRLKPGDVYDDAYARKYQFEEILPLKTQSGARPRVETQLDRDKHLVNLRIVFK